MRQNPLTSIGPWSATSCGETDRAGRIIERKRLTRRQMERFIDALEAGTEVVMEGCGTAHDWGSNSKPCRPCIGSARNGRPRCARINVMRGLLRASAKRDRQGRAAAAAADAGRASQLILVGFLAHRPAHEPKDVDGKKKGPADRCGALG